MTNKLPKYDNYKPSNVEWLGDIPQHWEVIPLNGFTKLVSKTGKPQYQLLSVYLEKGVIRFSDVSDKRTNVTSEDLTKYQIVEEGNLVLNNQQAWRGSVGVSKFIGIISPAYLVLEFSKLVDSVFVNYLFRDTSVINYYVIFSRGVGTIQRNLYWQHLKNVKIWLPPLSEQEKIAQFLDEKTTKIDQAVGIKQRQIELLKERRQILIHRAVTRGLNVNVPLKDSGVDGGDRRWIGEIPEHWEVKKTKFLFDEINERSKTGAEELLSVSHLTGVTPRSEKNVTMFQSEDYTDSKLCQKDDLVFNIMWAWMGALGVSDRTGIVSPSYAIYRQKNKDFFNMKYVEHLLSSINYIEHYNRVSTGLHSSRLRFYSNMFFDMKIGFPPQEEQNKIIEYIENISAKISKAIGLKEREIEVLKEYKSSLINSAVTGKVRVF